MAINQWPTTGGVASVNGLTGSITLAAGSGISLTPSGNTITIASLTTGTVTSVSVVSANGVSGTVATATTTPAITLSLGAITPTSVAASGAVTGSNLSGTNTGNVSLSTANGLSLSGQALSLQAADGTHTGALSSSDWASFNSAAVGANFSGKVLYVNRNRTDSYTEDGSFSNPFKTIMGAVNKVIANGDNSQPLPYLISIVGAGIYAEQIDLNSTSLVNLVINGNNIALIQSAVAISSISNNSGLLNLSLLNLGIFGDINFICTTNNSGMFSGSGIFAFNCSVTGNVTQKNAVNGIWQESTVFGDFYVENFDTLSLYSPNFSVTNFSLVTNLVNPVPYLGFPGTFCVGQAGVCSTSVSSIDAASTLQLRSGCRFSSAAGTLAVDGVLQSYSSFIRGSITVNSGGSFDNRGSFYDPSSLTINAGGDLSNSLTSSKVLNYTPTTSSNWSSVPSDPSTALDDLASSGVFKSQTANTVLAAPNGSSGVPGFRALLAADIPSLPYASSTLTSAHLFVGNVSNVATSVAVTGDVTISNAGVTAIGANKVANSQLAQMSAHTFKGNNTSSTANAIDLSATQLTAELNQFTSSLQGVVPSSGGGTTNFLRADGSWAAPGGGGGAPANSTVWLVSPNGSGSSATFIRRFNTTIVNTGSDITYADSSTNGASFTINTTGRYCFTWWDTNNAAGTIYLGFTIDQSNLTQGITSVPAGNRLSLTVGSLGNFIQASTTYYVGATSVIRPVWDGVISSDNANAGIIITRVS